MEHDDLNQVLARLRMKHPHWPQEKREWIAKRMLSLA